MKIEHTFEVTTKCPQGGTSAYTITMVVYTDDKFPLVEDIDDFLGDLLAKPIYQEDLTRLLSERFGADVTSEGDHGRFHTEVTIDNTNPSPRR